MTPERPILVAGLLLMLVVFVLDLQLAGVSVSLLHLVILLLGLRGPSGRDVLILAGAGVTLTLLAALIAGHDSSAHALTNLILAVIAITVTAGGVYRYRSSEQQRRAAQRHAADLERALNQSVILAITDVRGTITYVNDEFCRISQYSRQELIGQDHRIVNSGLHPAEFFAEMYGALAAGRTWRGEIRNRAKDGSFYWVDTTIVPFTDASGRPTQYVAIHQDVTVRRQVEKEVRDRDVLAKLEKMASMVAHEVRNPLAAMKGALQVIARRLEGAPERAVIDEVIARVDTLTRIVADLLGFARLRSPLLTRVPLASLVAELAAQLRDHAHLAETTIRADLDDVTVTADRDLLRTALWTLIVNSAEAMAGQGEIRITARPIEAHHELRIVDNGPGLPPNIRERLFEPFFTTKPHGTGLGLATARRIVTAHGGTLDLVATPGGGTTAIVGLPNPETPQVAAG
jgi:PAS domain S-box-containing protein